MPDKKKKAVRRKAKPIAPGEENRRRNKDWNYVQVRRPTALKTVLSCLLEKHEGNVYAVALTMNLSPAAVTSYTRHFKIWTAPMNKAARIAAGLEKAPNEDEQVVLTDAQGKRL